MCVYGLALSDEIDFTREMRDGWMDGWMDVICVSFEIRGCVRRRWWWAKTTKNNKTKKRRVWMAN